MSFSDNNNYSLFFWYMNFFWEGGWGDGVLLVITEPLPYPIFLLKVQHLSKGTSLFPLGEEKDNNIINIMVTAPGSRLQRQKIQIYPRSAQTQICVFKGETELTLNSNFVSYTRILYMFFPHKHQHYSQTRSSVPPKNPLMNLLFKRWICC